MAYHEKLARMTRDLLLESGRKLEEKAMFGGLCFMVNGKMCLGVEKDRLMVRLDPAIYETVLEQQDCRPMDFTGKPMKGFVFVDAGALTTLKKLRYWVELALTYNLKVKPAKKKIKKTGTPK